MLHTLWTPRSREKGPSEELTGPGRDQRIRGEGMLEGAPSRTHRVPSMLLADFRGIGVTETEKCSTLEDAAFPSRGS